MLKIFSFTKSQPRARSYREKNRILYNTNAGGERWVKTDVGIPRKNPFSLKRVLREAEDGEGKGLEGDRSGFIFTLVNNSLEADILTSRGYVLGKETLLLTGHSY